MRFKKLIAIVLSILLTLTCLPISASAGNEPKAEYIEGEVVIYSLKDVEDSHGELYTCSDDTVYVDFDEVGIDSITELEAYSEEDNMYIAETDGDVEKLCDELNKNGDIIAEPNYILRPCGITMPGEVTGNTFYYSNYQKWYLNDRLHVPEAWQKHQVNGSGVTVAVIDNGFDISSTDFSTNLWRNSGGTVGWNVCTNSDDIGPIRKSNGSLFNTSGHGTNVAGIIGMRSNSDGGVGVAYGAQLMLIQASSYDNDNEEPDFSNAAVARAIDFARENGADIINLSLGSSSNSVLIALAISRAKDAGVLVVAAAGNDGLSTNSQKFYPAALNTVIGVMAIDKYSDTLSFFSNYDTESSLYYDIAAPGVEILGCGTNSYTLYSGTSQATPIVSAVAALYMEKYPDNTVDQLKNDMITSARETVSAYSLPQLQFKSLNALSFLDFRSEHSWGEWRVVQEATCLSAGIRSRKCVDCGKTESESIPKADHDYEISVVEPTCRLRGYTQHTCKYCGNAYRDLYVAALGHIYSDWSAVGYSADYSSISAQRECMYCHQSQTKTLSNAIHSCTFDGNMISGFYAGMKTDDFLNNNTSSANATVSVRNLSGNTVGTGSVVSVEYSTGDVLSFDVVIYGDLNGDGWYDGMDSLINSGIVDNLITQEDTGEFVYTAADCNHDGVIDMLDVTILQEAGVLLTDINQSRSGELEASSVYGEYLSLINQSPDSEKTSQTDNRTQKSTPLNAIVSFFQDIIALIRSIIDFVNAGYPGLPFEK